MSQSKLLGRRRIAPHFRRFQKWPSKKVQTWSAIISAKKTIINFSGTYSESPNDCLSFKCTQIWAKTLSSGRKMALKKCNFWKICVKFPPNWWRHNHVIMTSPEIFMPPTTRPKRLSNRPVVEIGCILKNVGEESPPNLVKNVGIDIYRYRRGFYLCLYRQKGIYRVPWRPAEKTR